MESQRPKRKAAEAAIASLAQSQQSPKKRTPSSSRKGRKNRKQQGEKTAEKTTLNPVENEKINVEPPQEVLPSNTIKQNENLESTVDQQQGTAELPKTEEIVHATNRENAQEQNNTTLFNGNDERGTVQPSTEAINLATELSSPLQSQPPTGSISTPPLNQERNSEEISNNVAVNSIVQGLSEHPQPARETVDVSSNFV
ncbi:hypothetical protein GpartN1_g1455.t1 [Galdieria partita]|uniref:Uncharacterized protein n=1 Tax=Galdieria partita TaxID=83374 RepID=A0A9C7PSV8_9RHOD|nr:hypothetical protein GpartN1_g1455.t1 [Galdieria partita]